MWPSIVQPPADGLSAEQPGAWPGETCWGHRARWGEMGGASIRELLREGFWRKAQISWDFLDISGWVLSRLPPTSPAENWELLLAGLQTSCRACKHEISVHSALLLQ